MKLEGSFPIAAPRAKVWDAIRDPGLMALCVPGCESAEQVGPQSYRAIVGVKFGPISARFNLMLEIEEEVAPRLVKAKARGEEGSRASMVSSDNIMTLEEVAPDRTEVAWEADVNVTGRLGKYGLGLMKKKVESLSADFVKAFAERVEAGDTVR